MKIDLKAALKEMKTKTEEELEYETAVKWAARSMACYTMAYQAKEKDNEEDRIKYLRCGDDLRHEALEHAALVMDYGKTVGEVQKQIEELRSVAEE